MRPLFVPDFISKHNRQSQYFLDHIQDIRKNIAKLVSDQPLISIIIPAYNEEKNILRTLSSLSCSLTKYPIEIIVVDNNSSDGTKELVLNSGAKYLFEGKQGVKNARNTGLANAKGKYIMNADADTIYSPFWIDSIIHPLISNENVAVAYGKFAFIPEPGYNRLSFFMYENFGDVYKNIQGRLKDKAMYIYGCSSAYRREQGLAVDGYEHPPGANEDGYLGLKLRNKFGKIKQVTHFNSIAWTSSRKFIADGTLTNRVLKRIKKIFKGQS